MTPSLPAWIQQAMNQTLAEANTQAANLNANLVTNFNGAFSNWSQAVVLGKIALNDPNNAPPSPPTGYIVTTDENGWAQVVKGTAAVCPMPALPTVPTAPSNMVVAIGARIANTNYWAALPANANVPNGYTTPSPVSTSDNVTGFFTYVQWPFGGWWEKVG